MDAIQSWCTDNNMSVSAGKTVFTILGADEEEAEEISKKVDLSVDGDVLKYEAHATFLGVRLDPGLTMESHVNVLLQRAARRTQLIVKANSATFSISPKNRRSIWLALVGSIIRHGIAAYGPLLMERGSTQVLSNLKDQITAGAKMITGLPHSTAREILLDSAGLCDLDDIMREECVRSYVRAQQMIETNPFRE